MELRLLLLKAIERCFLVVCEVYMLFIMSIIYAVQGESVHEILWSDHLNESY